MTGYTLTSAKDISDDGTVVVGMASGPNGSRPYIATVPMDANPNSPPVADAGADQTVECESSDGTLVALDGTGSFDPDGDSLTYEWSVAEGSGAALDDPASATPIGLFPIGPTLVTLTVTDGNGGVSVADVLVTVVDTQPPVVVCTTNAASLWPPQHQMEVVDIAVVASDVCSNPESMAIYCTITSNEPDDYTGDGATIGDVDGEDGFSAPVTIDLTYDPMSNIFQGTVLLRAERNGEENGRVYSIVCDMMDESGNFATSSCVVIVPHDKRKNK